MELEFSFMENLFTLAESGSNVAFAASIFSKAETTR